MAEQAPALTPDPMAAALEYAGFGWRVIPIGIGKKHPPVPEWQNAATTDVEMIRMWWTQLYRDHGVGIATGRGSGVFVVDVDVSEGKYGDETLADLEATYGALPATVEVQTGTGGRHLYFRYPRGREVRNNASGRLGAGLDIRGDGGQVLAPPTIHPNGRPYVWLIGQGPLEHHIAHAPAWLLDIVCEAPPAPPAPKPTGTELVLPRPQDRPGDRWEATVTWRELLERDGWTFHHHDPKTGEDHWTRPGKERRDGTSATTGYGPGDTLKVFTSSHPILKAEATYSKFAYLTATRFSGDYRAASAWCAEHLDGLRSNATPAEPVQPLEPSQFEAVAMRGGDALASVEEAPPARWGDGDSVLWACGESLLIAGRTGTGKTTLATGILAGLVGLEPVCLGLSVRAAEKVLYLGMDRPRQILRALSRRFPPETFRVLNERLIFRKGPLPKDLAKEPSLLLTLAQQYGCDVVIVDSLKDAAVKVADEEVGGQINRAIQMCNAQDVDVLVLHHQRKGNVAERKKDAEEDQPSVEDVFGSGWITAGAGSVIILQGQPGDNLVKLWHVKQPADPVGPWVLEHDHHHGRTERQAGGFDLLVYLRAKGDQGTTALDAAKTEHGTDKLKSSGKEVASAKRRLQALVKAGYARLEESPGFDHLGRQLPAKWFAESRDAAEKSRDGGRDGVSRETSVTGSVTPVTDCAFPLVKPVTDSVTPRDGVAPVTLGGGIYTPKLTVQALEEHSGRPQWEEF